MMLTEARSSRSGRVATLVCGALIVQFIIVAWLAVQQKNATYDENFHVLGAYSSTWLRDFRVDPDNFTLWQYWAALPLGKHGVQIDTAAPLWAKLASSNSSARDDWAVLTLYRTTGNDAETILHRARAMML